MKSRPGYILDSLLFCGFKVPVIGDLDTSGLPFKFLASSFGAFTRLADSLVFPLLISLMAELFCFDVDGLVWPDDSRESGSLTGTCSFLALVFAPLPYLVPD